MAIQYTWKVHQLERDPATGVVKIVHWNCLGIDTATGNSLDLHGATSVGPADPDATDFIPFEELKEQDILEWVWPEIVKEDQEAFIAQQIELKNNPPVVTGLPW